jgi:hypothetical protein
MSESEIDQAFIKYKTPQALIDDLEEEEISSGDAKRIAKMRNWENNEELQDRIHAWEEAEAITAFEEERDPSDDELLGIGDGF